MIVGLFSSSAFAEQYFGSPGSAGWSARSGRDGASGAQVVLDVDGRAHTFDVPGLDGTDASGQAEDGNAASYCYQPRSGDGRNFPPYDLRGADGGDGGDGARGGNGGDGGNVYFFVTNQAQLSQLKKIAISNPGGSPGESVVQAGRGAPGCRCTQSSWSIQMCKWDFYQIIPAQNGQPEQRIHLTSQTEDCTYDSNPPRHYPANGEWQLANRSWESYSCRDGRWGTDGRPGRQPNLETTVR